MNWKKYLSLIGIILFIYILIKIDIYQVVNEIKNADVSLIILSFFVVFVLLLLQTLKWFVIAIKQGIDLSFKDAFKINFITNFYGFITPSRLGTVLRAEYLKKYTPNIGKGLCNFVLDKALDLLSLVTLVILFSFIFKNKFSFLPINLFIVIFIGLISLTFIFLNKERARIILKVFYKKLIPNKLKEKTRITFDSFYENMPKKRYFLFFFALNIFTWVILYLVTYIIGVALGIELSFIYYLAIFPISALISMLPISINGIGTREVVLISLFSLFGVPAAKVFSMSLVSIVISGVLPAVIGSFLTFKNE
ncbi:MAG: lysylphosphatidylglycerol synthase transmembrane domain-containing protein [Nanoarchaeota archaeon]|nr:lysylphosphatidylglycerol synthase transmembrane domain-containing protein [Nanoarchaeota archaeon]